MTELRRRSAEYSDIVRLLNSEKDRTSKYDQKERNAMLKSVQTINREFKNIKQLCGDEAHDILKDHYINKLTQGDIARQQSVSKSTIRRKIDNWEKIYAESESKNI